MENINHISVYSIQNGNQIMMCSFLFWIKHLAYRHQLLKKNTHTHKLINNQMLANFQALLKEEIWKTEYSSSNINSMFNNFHFIYLRHYDRAFQLYLRNMKTISQNGQRKVFKYHVKITETFILHVGILIIQKKKTITRNNVQC